MPVGRELIPVGTVVKGVASKVVVKVVRVVKTALALFVSVSKPERTPILEDYLRICTSSHIVLVMMF